MIEYFQTTTLILIWCLVLSLLCAATAYARARRQSPKESPKAGVQYARRQAPRLSGLGFLLLPSLVIAPLVLVLAFRVFGVNLLFPVLVFASIDQIILAALAPAVVLMVASGLAGDIWRQTKDEYSFWRSKPFATAALAYGKDVGGELRLLVLLKALSASWAQCLPWLFGELIVVEVVFNAPGLGLDAWNLAKARDLSELMWAAGWLLLLFLFFTGLSHGLSRWFGKRLEGYL